MRSLEMRMYLYNSNVPLVEFLLFSPIRCEEEILRAPILCISYQDPDILPSISSQAS